MNVSYKKLWKLLIDKDMKKKDLREAAAISTSSMAKLGKNENVTTDVLVKICKALKWIFPILWKLLMMTKFSSIKQFSQTKLHNVYFTEWSDFFV